MQRLEPMLQGFKAYQLALRLYRECERVPAAPHLKDQLSRASLSVVLNLAEGSAKPTAKDRRRFYSIALASTREVQALITILGRNDLDPLADQTGACLYRLVNPRREPLSPETPGPGTTHVAPGPDETRH